MQQRAMAAKTWLDASKTHLPNTKLSVALPEATPAMRYWIVHRVAMNLRSDIVVKKTTKEK